MSAPSEELLSRLQGQLQFYFSDANLRRDKFLLARTGEHGTGEVPVATLAGFNRILAMTKDTGAIVQALRRCDVLRVSEDGLHVARKWAATTRLLASATWHRHHRPAPPLPRRSPLPDDKTSASRTVYVEHLPVQPRWAVVSRKPATRPGSIWRGLEIGTQRR